MLCALCAVRCACARGCVTPPHSLTPQVTHLTNRLKESRASLTKGQKDYEAQQTELAKLEREVKDVLAAQSKFEAEYQKLIKEQDIVPEDQIDEYDSGCVCVCVHVCV